MMPQTTLSDEVILRVLRRVNPADLKSCSLVSRTWNRLHGQIKTSLKLYDWSMLDSGRLAERFPSLTDVDLSPAWCNSSDPEVFGSSAVYMTRGACTMRLDPDVLNPFDSDHRLDEQSPAPDSFDEGLRELARSYPGLQRLCVVDVFRARKGTRNAARDELGFLGHSHYRSSSFDLEINGYPSSLHLENGGGRGSNPARYNDDYFDHDAEGLEIIANGCPTLQELEVRQCTDDTLDCVAGCTNLQVVRLVGAVPGFYHATFTDRGLRTLARSCQRIVELSLKGCEVGADGLSAVARECPMLSDLTLSGRHFRPDWLGALCHCPNLQTLRLENFHQMEPEECAAAIGGGVGQGQAGKKKFSAGVERLQLVHCDLRPRVFFMAVVGVVCDAVRELELRNCCGLEDASFAGVALCRRIQRLHLEGCPLITMASLETVVLALRDLRQLAVSNCGAVRDNEMSGGLADKIFALKELKWQPSAGLLAGTGLFGKGRWLVPSVVV